MWSRATRPRAPRCRDRASRQVCTWSASSCSRRASRSVGSVTARRYSWNTICCAGVGQTTSLSQRRWTGPQVARPV